MSTTTVGLVGLGVMGLPVGLRLRSAGFDVLGRRRTAAPEAFLAAGGRAASSVEQVAHEPRW